MQNQEKYQMGIILWCNLYFTALKSSSVWPENGPNLARKLARILVFLVFLARNQPEFYSSPSPTRAKNTGPKPDPGHKNSGPTQPYNNQKNEIFRPGLL